jgi:hypothetical protein
MGKGMAFQRLNLTRTVTPPSWKCSSTECLGKSSRTGPCRYKDYKILNRGHKYGKRNEPLNNIKNCHSSFMEMLKYQMPWEVVKNRTLQVKYLTGVINMGKGMLR